MRVPENGFASSKCFQRLKYKVAKGHKRQKRNKEFSIIIAALKKLNYLNILCQIIVTKFYVVLNYRMSKDEAENGCKKKKNAVNGASGIFCTRGGVHDEKYARALMLLPLTPENKSITCHRNIGAA